MPIFTLIFIIVLLLSAFSTIPAMLREILSNGGNYYLPMVFIIQFVVSFVILAIFFTVLSFVHP